MSKDKIDEMTNEEVAEIDEDKKDHPADYPATVADDDGVIGDDIPDDALNA